MDESVEAYINKLPDAQQRADSLQLVAMMQKASGAAPKMWGSSIIGFGINRYKSPRTGREVDWFKIGFSPRKANLSLHFVFDLQAQEESLSKLGKHKTGVGCLYIKKLADIDLVVLEKLIKESLKDK